MQYKFYPPKTLKGFYFGLYLVVTIFIITLAGGNAMAFNYDSLLTKNGVSVKAKQPIQRQLYLSWGYNEEWYTNSTVHISQPALGNDYGLIHVNAHNHKGWDEGLLHEQLTIPQYNYRIGYYFNDKQDMAIELNFDHTKYIITDNQPIHLTGTINNKPADYTLNFAASNGFYYYLNNGANFFLINFVKRFGLYKAKTNNLLVDFIGKAGIGPVVPHVQNSFFGQANNPNFQFGGWNTGIETVLRVTFLHNLFFEFSQKGDYARYSHLKIYDGLAKQNFGTYELILSGGIIFPTTKKSANK